MRGRVKYYFRKTRGAIVKDLLTWLALTGVVLVTASSPYFVRQLLRGWKQGQKYKLRSKDAAFYRMRKAGLLLVERQGFQYRVSLTKKGKEHAGWLQLDSLEVKRPNQWQGSWYFLLFDIAQTERWKRDILRSFLERLGFALFQKSVWVHAHDCCPELEMLKAFLGLTQRELKLVVVKDEGLERDDSHKLRRYFKIT